MIIMRPRYNTNCFFIPLKDALYSLYIANPKDTILQYCGTKCYTMSLLTQMFAFNCIQ